LKKNKKTKAVFLDRDGVINYDLGYVYKISKFKFKKNVFKALEYINKKKYLAIIVTNQSGIGRGYYSIKDLKILHNWMKQKVRKKNGIINDIFFAPYYEFSKIKFSKKDKLNRKPNIGMIKDAQKKWSIDLKKSFMIGDSLIDKKCAKKAKLKFIKVNKNYDLLKLVSKKIK